jgi:hypothetical protein
VAPSGRKFSNWVCEFGERRGRGRGREGEGEGEGEGEARERTSG